MAIHQKRAAFKAVKNYGIAFRAGYERHIFPMSLDLLSESELNYFIRQRDKAEYS
jgi:hypothetical protein